MAKILKIDVKDWVFFGVLIVGFIGFRIWQSKDQPSGPLFVSADEARQQHGLFSDDDLVVRIDRTEVPDRFHDLIPLAERWGVLNAVARIDRVKLVRSEDKDQFENALRDRGEDLKHWLASFKDADALPQAARHFQAMLYALDEMRPEASEP